MSVWDFYSFHDGEYSGIFIVAAVSSKSFSGKTPLPVQNSYLPTFFYDETEISSV